MTIPKQVRMQAEEVERLHSELYPQKPSEQAGAPANTSADDSANMEPQTEVEAGEDITGDSALEVDLATAKEVEAPEGEEAEEAEEAGADEQLAGPDVQQELSALYARLAASEQRVDLLEREVKRLASARMDVSAPKIDVSKLTLATDAEIDEYGDDLVRVAETLVKRLAGPLAAHVTERVSATIAPQVDEVATLARADAARARGMAVWAQLRAAIPDADKINKDPAWLSWLEKTDPVSGQVRQQLLLQAFEAGDGNRVVAIMREFLGKRAPAKSGRVPMASLAAPSQSGQATAPRNGLRIKPLTQKEISDTYADLIARRRAARNDPQRLAALDKEEAAFAARIAEAQRAGVVR